MADHDEATMRIALDLAQAAAQAGETPVGAVVRDPATGKVIARAHNNPIALRDPTAHAEILAIRAAARKVGNYRLTGLELFVTLEPCAMCAGAISHARIGRLVCGAADEKGGAVIHGARVFDLPTTHWRPEVEGGVLADESATLLKGFFQARREAEKPSAAPAQPETAEADQPALTAQTAEAAPAAETAPVEAGEAAWVDSGPAPVAPPAPPEIGQASWVDSDGAIADGHG